MLKVDTVIHRYPDESVLFDSMQQVAVDDSVAMPKHHLTDSDDKVDDNITIKKKKGIEKPLSCGHFFSFLIFLAP